jgi:hypothetical protein
MGLVMRDQRRSLKERLALEAIQLHEKAKRMPAGTERDELLKKARRLAWLRSWITGFHLLD